MAHMRDSGGRGWWCSYNIRPKMAQKTVSACWSAGCYQSSANKPSSNHRSSVARRQSLFSRLLSSISHRIRMRKACSQMHRGNPHQRQDRHTVLVKHSSYCMRRPHPRIPLSFLPYLFRPPTFFPLLILVMTSSASKTSESHPYKP
jgi:hypothetical protein